jgi:hypothetical protein
MKFKQQEMFAPWIKSRIEEVLNSNIYKNKVMTNYLKYWWSFKRLGCGLVWLKWMNKTVFAYIKERNTNESAEWYKFCSVGRCFPAKMLLLANNAIEYYNPV